MAQHWYRDGNAVTNAGFWPSPVTPFWFSGWWKVYSPYLDTYASHVRELESFVRDHPRDPAGHFLLGYHALVMGRKEAARSHLTAAVALTPKDEIAQQLLNRL